MTTRLEDLLDRDPIAVPDGDVREAVAGRRVLVTGAAGSIGSALSRRLLGLGVDRLVLLDSSEQSLHELSIDLPDRPGYGRARLVLGDAGDARGMAELLHAERVQFVFHAAAFKHAPLLEGQPFAAVSNNLLVTARLMEQAGFAECERFVLVSTDKAVRPRSMLGATKRLAELLVLASVGPGATAVRLGNVWGSRGSVVPYFLARLAAGEPLVVTDPAATRYFMSESEAVSVTLGALPLGRAAEVLVPVLGPPIAILDIANRMLTDRGRAGIETAALRYSGLRPGDKLSELLFDPEEQRAESDHAGIARVIGPAPDRDGLLEGVGRLAGACRRWDRHELIAILRELLPEYVPSAELMAGSCPDPGLPAARG